MMTIVSCSCNNQEEQETQIEKKTLQKNSHTKNKHNFECL
jgi:hypothetical protein